LNSTLPGLKHQRQHKHEEFDKNWYNRGQKAGPAAIKFRKGACANCGAMTHKAMECVERPRKVGAKWTSDDIKPDEIIQDVHLDYDGKRDRWNGYDPNTYKKVMAAYDKADVERRKKKQEASLDSNITEPDENQARFPNKGKEGENKQESALADESDSESDSDRETEEGFKEGTGYNNAPVQKMDPKTRTTIRNLRIREDTAKYLRNLDLNSAYYDPKTRSMRENPNPHGNPSEQLYAGDNFVRGSGDVTAFYDQQLYAWEAYEKGQEVHVQANPSQAELLYQDYNKKKDQLKKKSKETILYKYGGEEHLDVVPKELLLAQTEAYVEYSADGKVIKGVEKAVPRSKYEEDKYLNNHTAVWGSYWENGEWGFACCKQLVKNSYCTGAAGIALREQMVRDATAIHAGSDEPVKSLVEQSKSLKKQKEKEMKEKEEKEKKEKEERFQKALKAEDALRKTQVEGDERKRAYNSLAGGDINISEEDLEAYKLKRVRADDPMKDFL